jgi:3-oxoacyl-[acyl-carrier protein] reductase
MNVSLENKRAFVCGSTAGIGRATARELASLGAQVTLLARNEDKLKNLRDSLARPQGQAHDYLVADFSQPEELKNRVASYLQQHPNPFIS